MAVPFGKRVGGGDALTAAMARPSGALEEIVYDPTKFVTRCEAVVACAKTLRAELGPVVRNIYVDVRRRALYIIVPDAQSDEAARVALVRRVAIVMTRWQATNGVGLTLAARIGVEPPRDAHLISVDNASVALYSAMLTPGMIAPMTVNP